MRPDDRVYLESKSYKSSIKNSKIGQPIADENTITALYGEKLSQKSQTDSRPKSGKKLEKHARN